MYSVTHKLVLSASRLNGNLIYYIKKGNKIFFILISSIFFLFELSNSKSLSKALAHFRFCCQIIIKMDEIKSK